MVWLAFYTYLCGLWSFRAIFNLKTNFLTFGQGFKAIALDSGKMYEDIGATFGRRDKTKTL